MFSKTKIALSAAMVLSTAFPASQLEKEWSTFTTADKTDCVSLANTGGESSYTELITCMEMARDVRKLHSDAKACLSRTYHRRRWVIASRPRNRV